MAAVNTAGCNKPFFMGVFRIAGNGGFVHKGLRGLSNSKFRITTDLTDSSTD
jgi:hypothetical protein